MPSWSSSSSSGEHCYILQEEFYGRLVLQEDGGFLLLEECFGYEIGPKGVRIPNQPQSSYMGFDKWRRLIDWVLVWGPTELGVDIPPPRKAEASD